MESYLPRPFGGRVTLFRAGASMAPGAVPGAADLTEGWDQLATTEAHLIADADHGSLLQMPALDQLVELLENAFAAGDEG